jgi:hypothetical protein
VDDYTAFLRDAPESAARLYTALAKCDLYVEEMQLTNGCRMSYDPQLYYNPEAEVLPVVREQKADPLAPYEGAKTDDEGNVNHDIDLAERQRIELEYQTCLLIKLRIAPTDIATILSRDTSTISTVRSRLYKKVFDKKGGAREWDEFIMSIGA